MTSPEGAIWMIKAPFYLQTTSKAQRELHIVFLEKKKMSKYKYTNFPP